MLDYYISLRTSACSQKVQNSYSQNITIMNVTQFTPQGKVSVRFSAVTFEDPDLNIYLNPVIPV